MSLSAPIQPSATAVKTKAIGQLEIFTIVRGQATLFIPLIFFVKLITVYAQCNDNFFGKISQGILIAFADGVQAL